MCAAGEVGVGKTCMQFALAHLPRFGKTCVVKDFAVAAYDDSLWHHNLCVYIRICNIYVYVYV